MNVNNPKYFEMTQSKVSSNYGGGAVFQNGTTLLFFSIQQNPFFSFLSLISKDSIPKSTVEILLICFSILLCCRLFKQRRIKMEIFPYAVTLLPSHSPIVVSSLAFFSFFSLLSSNLILKVILLAPHCKGAGYNCPFNDQPLVASLTVLDHVAKFNPICASYGTKCFVIITTIIILIHCFIRKKEVQYQWVLY